MSHLASLDDAARELLTLARRGVLATIRPDGRPRLVPVVFAADEARDGVYLPLDDKPKAVTDVRQLARVRDIAARPEVELLIDRFEEDWARLAWLRLSGRASLLEPAEQASEHAAALRLLRARYPQYESQALERRPVVRIAVEQVRSWAST